MSTKWKITLVVYRQKGGAAPYYDEFKMEVNPDEYVLDAVERVWAFHDRSLCFAHACHHSMWRLWDARQRCRKIDLHHPYQGGHVRRRYDEGGTST